jgi:cobalt/nickel transport protein
MNKSEILLSLILAIVLIFFISPFASKKPDGLERVAEDKGFLSRAEGKPIFSSPLADYIWAGPLIVFGVSWAVAKMLKGHKR